MTAISQKTAAHKPKMTAISQNTFEKGQWSIVCSNYLEIPVGQSENNSRERKDKQRATVQKKQSEKGTTVGKEKI